ncbi:helix-turn-helix domain-containing protein [Patulibacter sp. SYSU D01012]|uniref:TetR/AcrR family transcriptional regulator n=1 Tax=Patulibacter sp. SYSU D01012 TaxID=2817381 RepID=UPI001B30CB00|nr:helix-turn-helix domain-containing protein [Patulibacter sp. SYSU D01012]
MPPTKPRQDREEKRAELVAAARRLFVEDGFDATSMAALARAAGVAPNTIYWYFGDKDDLLVAVLDAVLADALAAYADVAERPIVDQVLWTVGQLQALRGLVTTVHARIGRSEALNAWHDAFHATAEGLLRASIEQAVPADALDAEVRIAVFTVEGLLTHALTTPEQRAVCARLASRWA